MLIACAGLALAGCASMNRSECLVNDWQTIGYEDGARGYGSEQVARYRKACAKHGVAPDLAAYQAGRADGLLEYCKPGRGFALGRSGAGYAGVCPTELEGAFLDAYNAGRRLHQLRTGVVDAKQQMHQRQRELEKVEAELVTKEAVLVGEDKTTQERMALLVEIKHLYETRERLQAEIDELIDIRSRREDELYAYEAELGGGF